MHYPSVEDKFETVIGKNTFYFQNKELKKYYKREFRG